MEPGNIIKGEVDDGLNRIFDGTMRMVNLSDRSDDTNKPGKADAGVNMKDEIQRMTQELDLKIPEKVASVKKAQDLRGRIQEDMKEDMRMCDAKKKAVIDLFQNLIQEQEQLDKYEKQKNENQLKLDKQNELVAQEERNLEILREQKRKVSRMEAVRLKQEQFAEAKERDQRKITDLENELKVANWKINELKRAYEQALREYKSVDERDNLVKFQDAHAVREEVIVTTTTQSPNSYLNGDDLHLQHWVPPVAAPLENDERATYITSSQARTVAQMLLPQTTECGTVEMQENYHRSPETVEQENRALQDLSSTSEKITSSTNTEPFTFTRMASPEDSLLNKGNFGDEEQPQACEVPLNCRLDEGNDKQLSENVGNINTRENGEGGAINTLQEQEKIWSTYPTTSSSPFQDVGPPILETFTDTSVSADASQSKPSNDEPPTLPSAATTSTAQIQHGVDVSLTDSTSNKFHCLCKQSFSTKDSLSFHISSCTREWKFKCEKCNERRFTLSMLKIHYKGAHKMHKAFGKFKTGCTHCGTMFRTKEEFSKHKPTCNQITDHELTQKAEMEKKSHTPNNSLRLHLQRSLNMPQGKGPLCCQLPRKSPRKSSKIRRKTRTTLPNIMQKSVVEIKPESGSEQQSISVESKKIKLNHKEDITKRIKHKAYFCLCGEQYDTLLKLQSHVRSQSKEGGFSCPKCPSGFEMIKLLKEHGHDAHKMDFQLEGCYECGALFPSTEMLAAHEKSHNKNTVVDLITLSPAKSANRAIPQTMPSPGTPSRISKTTIGSETSPPTKRMRKQIVNEREITDSDQIRLTFWECAQMKHTT